MWWSFLFFHSKNSYANAPRCFRLRRALCVLLVSAVCCQTVLEWTSTAGYLTNLIPCKEPQSLNQSDPLWRSTVGYFTNLIPCEDPLPDTLPIWTLVKIHCRIRYQSDPLWRSAVGYLTNLIPCEDPLSDTWPIWSLVKIRCRILDLSDPLQRATVSHLTNLIPCKEPLSLAWPIWSLGKEQLSSTEWFLPNRKSWLQSLDQLTTETRDLPLHLWTEVAVTSCYHWYTVDRGQITRTTRGLPGKYPAILNISRTGRVALM